MPHLYRLALLSAAVLGTLAHAQGNEASSLLQTHGCLSCHAKAEKVVGPSFLSIADKYRGDKDAAASLAQSIRNGSRGKWGRIAMPPHTSLNQDEAQALARQVLASMP